MIPAVVTAGGRWRDGTPKALLEVGGRTLLGRVQDALHGSGRVDGAWIVGPEDSLQEHVSHPSRLIPEGATGIDNLRRGLAQVDAGDGLALFAATDLPFLSPSAVRSLVECAPGDADIVFPIFTRAEFERDFPGSPGIYTPMDGDHWTGGSAFLLRPAAIERNAALLERVFTARKRQWAMARLLGLSFALRFATGRLSIAAAEARATDLTGCRCRVVRGCDPALAFDVDDEHDLAHARRAAQEALAGA